MKETEIWANLRPLLNGSYNYNPSWQEAINLFRLRLENKFFLHQENLINDSMEGAGFPIVAIQCALIESIASFRTGMIFNHKCNKTSPKYEYNRSADIFKSFLNSDLIFRDHFYTIDNNGVKADNQPFDAGDFYDKVRCGLLHEARTKGEYLINQTKKIAKNETIFLERDGTNIRIYRSILHYRLKHSVETYCADLAETTQQGNTLRRYFARKLDHLFDYAADPNHYDWWNDK